MKRYESPELEIEKFTIYNIVTDSSNTGGLDNGSDTDLGEEFPF